MSEATFTKLFINYKLIFLQNNLPKIQIQHVIQE